MNKHLINILPLDVTVNVKNTKNKNRIHIILVIEKAWNSACYESKECRTEFCDDVDKVCLCPPNTIIDGNYNYCLDNTGKTGKIKPLLYVTLFEYRKYIKTVFE